MDARFKLFVNQDIEDSSKRDAYKQAIQNNLKTIKMREGSIAKILAAVEKLPCATQALAALDFFTLLTPESRRCEHHYLHSDYLAEYFCTISNLGFFGVAYYYSDCAALFAGTFSALSHAVPQKWLNDMDRFAALATFLKVLSHYELLKTNPEMMIGGAATGIFGLLDFFVGRKSKDKYGPTFHVLWHLSAAFALYQFNNAKGDIASTDLQAILLAASLLTVPAFLQSSYDAVTQYIPDLNQVKRCNIL